MSIDDIKNIMSHKLDLSKDEFRLIHSGKQLKDGTLEDNKLNLNNNIDLLVDLKGGSSVKVKRDGVLYDYYNNSVKQNVIWNNKDDILVFKLNNNKKYIESENSYIGTNVQINADIKNDLIKLYKQDQELEEFDDGNIDFNFDTLFDNATLNNLQLNFGDSLFSFDDPDDSTKRIYFSNNSLIDNTSSVELEVNSESKDSIDISDDDIVNIPINLVNFPYNDDEKKKKF
tara:strand:- start:70 stop:756 length:687 start_codon:yes stop_codon:yes gene_type:complete